MSFAFNLRHQRHFSTTFRTVRLPFMFQRRDRTSVRRCSTPELWLSFSCRFRVISRVNAWRRMRGRLQIEDTRSLVGARRRTFEGKICLDFSFSPLGNALVCAFCTQYVSASEMSFCPRISPFIRCSFGSFSENILASEAKRIALKTCQARDDLEYFHNLHL